MAIKYREPSGYFSKEMKEVFEAKTKKSSTKKSTSKKTGSKKTSKKR